ncbi:hypothetical protein CONPUDRAFT_58185 [Coniophora puteana RWD-64-598 SS2]|uniref:Reverse transcriptase Ty1/copia-type domain-containing protein n=1 Tax=Coniophora puteana (strain RWD-64-598) TaxID=741705 RepID=A0A5M3MNB5_CONPW|nr:uncharacterized protein CONPUDRAFT_58185 [Coniophora puteana RWD-64-598 SS2]EIW80111.1 hypothetical protein CONPUDRAFT_58185 [Coniophora puteana RWD-64-598 SS2]
MGKKGDLKKYNAQLVAKGFSQVPGVDFTNTFLPVIRQEILRIMLFIAVKKTGKYNKHLNKFISLMNGW